MKSRTKVWLKLSAVAERGKSCAESRLHFPPQKMGSSGLERALATSKWVSASTSPQHRAYMQGPTWHGRGWYINITVRSWPILVSAAGGGSQQNQVGLWRAGDPVPQRLIWKERANLGTSAVPLSNGSFASFPFCPLSPLQLRREHRQHG